MVSLSVPEKWGLDFPKKMAVPEFWEAAALAPHSVDIPMCMSRTEPLSIKLEYT